MPGFGRRGRRAKSENVTSAKVSCDARENTGIIRANRIEEDSSGLGSEVAKALPRSIRIENVGIFDGVDDGTGLLNLFQRGAEAVCAAGVVAVGKNQQNFVGHRATELEVG